MEEHFDNNHVGIYVQAVQNYPLEPYKVTLRAKSYQLKESVLKFEFQNTTLNSDNVKITEAGSHLYNVEFRNNEGTKATFHIAADQEAVTISREGF